MTESLVIAAFASGGVVGWALGWLWQRVTSATDRHYSEGYEDGYRQGTIEAANTITDHERHETTLEMP